MAESSQNLDGLGLDELKTLVLQVLEDNARLRQANEALCEEVARLKGVKGKPDIKPSGMEKNARYRRLE